MTDRGEDFTVECHHAVAGYCRACGMNEDDLRPQLPDGWTADGPRFKGAGYYLSSDGTNPEAPWPGYGWPLGTECWYYVLRLHGRGLRLHATGLTIESAIQRAGDIARSDDPARFAGAIRLVGCRDEPEAPRDATDPHRHPDCPRPRAAARVRWRRHGRAVLRLAGQRRVGGVRAVARRDGARH